METQQEYGHSEGNTTLTTKSSMNMGAGGLAFSPEGLTPPNSEDVDL